MPSTSFPGASRWAREPERGASAVEFALIVPVLLLLVFGIMNFGFIFATQISLNSAARDAARAGVVKSPGINPLTCQEIALRARDNATTIGAPATQIEVTVTQSHGTAPVVTVTCSVAAGASTATGSASTHMCTASAGAPLIVDLAFDYKSPVPIVPPSTLSMSSSAQFRCEYT